MQLTKLERFEKAVLSKYQMYNSIFMTLPFDDISNTGVLLPLFAKHCEQGFKNHMNPTQIMDAFFKQYFDSPTQEQKNELLFKFIQYIERQVVLFDAIEDAAFPVINNLDGHGTLRNVKDEANRKGKRQELIAYLERFKIRTVLTAHPTQFYPGAVLGIITDLAQAIEQNDLDLIRDLLAQLGKTPFFKKQKPTPYDEAVSLIWYLENIFYKAVGNVYRYIDNTIFEDIELKNQVINIGFWPGGDRDGNPFVTTQITLDVAKRLRATILKNYYRDLRALRRRITFKGTTEISAALETRIYNAIFAPIEQATLTAQEILDQLLAIRSILTTQHQSLFVEPLDDLISKVKLFGLYFASLDIRQDSRVHTTAIVAISKETTQVLPKNYEQLTDLEKIEVLSDISGAVDPSSLKTEIAKKTLESIYAIKTIQQNNGEQGCNRYIISNNGSVVNMLEAFAMIRMCDWEQPTVDVIPLFETVEDLLMAGQVMEALYTNDAYWAHLKRRNKKQSIMLGFSDGTKDGGYLMANWGIYTAKERITEVSRAHGVTVLFFDGRGGPPARGGGKTHQFYASLGNSIEHEEVQLTIQGQTISSNFGTVESCQYNLEQLLSSGIENEVFASEVNTLSEQDRQTISSLASYSYEAYVAFKAHEKFLPYLERMSTLPYYAQTNIGSRPAKRGASTSLVFKDLRAIPFVGSWSQLKQNVPGFYGVGMALETMEQEGKWEHVVALYEQSAFFRALLQNSMMSLTKSFFPLTAYMKDDPEFGSFWTQIHEEYQRTKTLLLRLSGDAHLMEDSPAMRASIRVREQIVLPLLTIQQYALKEIQQLKKLDTHKAQLAIYEKMVMRSLFGNINASRNSA